MIKCSDKWISQIGAYMYILHAQTNKLYKEVSYEQCTVQKLIYGRFPVDTNNQLQALTQASSTSITRVLQQVNMY